MAFTFTIRISAFFISAGVPNGEYPEILIAGMEGTLKIGRKMLPPEGSQV
jgi:hypothetical protein